MNTGGTSTSSTLAWDEPGAYTKFCNLMSCVESPTQIAQGTFVIALRVRLIRCVWFTMGEREHRYRRTTNSMMDPIFLEWHFLQDHHTETTDILMKKQLHHGFMTTMTMMDFLAPKKVV